MLSLRAVTRALPRSAARPLTSFRKLTVASRTGFLQSSLRVVSKPTYSAFSTSCIRKEPAGESDPELSAKFESEQRLEKENRDTSTVPEDLQSFITNGSWTIKDIPGTENVVLSKPFGNEDIKVEFNIADLSDHLDDAAMEEDTAMEDEDEFDDVDMKPPTKRTINESGVRGEKVDVMAEDSVAPSDRDEDMEAPAYPVGLQITITKGNTGAIRIGATAMDGVIGIEQVNFFPEAQLADPLTHEDDRRQEMIYAGPPFGNLDPDLQAMLERYVEERGINTELATFVPDYVDYKEQREYVEWLDNMKNFIDV